MKITELEEGNVYKTGLVVYLYRIKNGELQILKDGERWEESALQYNDVMKYDFIEVTDPLRIPNETTPIDTKVLCWEYDGDDKLRGYFSGMIEGRKSAFLNGSTSWSDDGNNDIECWEHMIIAEEE